MRRDTRDDRETMLLEVGRRPTIAADYHTLTPTPSMTDFRFTATLEEHEERRPGSHPVYVLSEP